MVTQSHDGSVAIEAQAEQLKQQLSQSGVQINQVDVTCKDDVMTTLSEKKETGKQDSSDNSRKRERFFQKEEATGENRKPVSLALGTNTVDYIG